MNESPKAELRNLLKACLTDSQYLLHLVLLPLLFLPGGVSLMLVILLTLILMHFFLLLYS